MPVDRAQLRSTVDEIGDQIVALSTKIHQNPELSLEEHRASGWIAECVESLTGIKVERGLGGMETAFRVRAGSRARPRVAILAEYDALPELGHACGHNLIAGGAVGAFVALARQVSEFAGSVELIGTPAEENGGGKIRLLKAGVFEGVDAAMMFHPFDRDLVAHPTLSSVRLHAVFRGAPAHAAFAPWDGKSALTACLDTFRLVDGQRVHFHDGVRVYGIVTEGGQAPNVIVERAACEFSLRARAHAELEPVVAAVTRCMRAAALASDVELEITRENGYREMLNNLTIGGRFSAALERLGRRPKLTDASIGAASTDMGDVSQAIPAIHPWLAICDPGETLCHQHAFAVCAGSPRGFESMLIAAKALAETALDLLEEPGLIERARSEHRAASAS
jgi:amidohydrolase